MFIAKIVLKSKPLISMSVLIALAIVLDLISSIPACCSSSSLTSDLTPL